jgi:hypothetical protein
MSKKTLKYKDTVVAQGSSLYEALEAGDLKKAEAIYNACEKEYRKYNKSKPVYSVADYHDLLVERATLLDKLFARNISGSEPVRLEEVRDELDRLDELRLTEALPVTPVKHHASSGGKPELTMSDYGKIS